MGAVRQTRGGWRAAGARADGGYGVTRNSYVTSPAALLRVDMEFRGLEIITDPIRELSLIEI